MSTWKLVPDTGEVGLWSMIFQSRTSFADARHLGVVSSSRPAMKIFEPLLLVHDGISNKNPLGWNSADKGEETSGRPRGLSQADSLVFCRNRPVGVTLTPTQRSVVATYLLVLHSLRLSGLLSQPTCWCYTHSDSAVCCRAYLLVLHSPTQRSVVITYLFVLHSLRLSSLLSQPTCSCYTHSDSAVCCRSLPVGVTLSDSAVCCRAYLVVLHLLRLSGLLSQPTCWCYTHFDSVVCCSNLPVGVTLTPTQRFVFAAYLLKLHSLRQFCCGGFYI
ncbi:hypothetical protein J6590_081084 [Homalodisca vitripennis]|nr:hypothetical protein J6590_081084 [Homalodisca vitripennis]